MVLSRRKLLLTCAAAPTVLQTNNDDADTSQVPTSPKAASVPEMIIDASRRYGLNQDQMLRIAWCESRWGQDPNAYNGRSGHFGVYQFKLSTWAWASVAAGYAGRPATDDIANVDTAAWLMATIGPSQWSCK